MFRYGLFYLLFSTLCFSADLFHHDLKKVPRTADCTDMAVVLAESFHKKTGFEVYWAGSLKEGKSSCDIRISYIAGSSLEFASSIDKEISASVLKGTHKTLADCQADLPREIDVFERATSLKSWISYCYVDDKMLEPYPFVPFVEGIGSAKARLFGTDQVVSVRPHAGWTAIVEEIQSNLLHLNILPASIRIRPYISVSEKELTVRFYGKERLWLSTLRLAKHKDPRTCVRQIKRIRKALSLAHIPPVSVYCGDYFQENWLNLIGLSTNILGIGKIETVLDPQKFSTLTQCEAAGPKILDVYEKKFGKNPLAFFCADTMGAFQATVFNEKKSN